ILLQVVRQMGRRGKPAAPALVRFLDSANLSLQGETLETLAAIGSDHPACVQSVRKLLESPDKDLRAKAKTALRSMTKADRRLKRQEGTRGRDGRCVRAPSSGSEIASRAVCVRLDSIAGEEERADAHRWDSGKHAGGRCGCGLVGRVRGVCARQRRQGR